MAIPRDIEDMSLENLQIYRIDDLRDISDTNHALRQEQAIKATEIVEYELYELQNIFAIVVIGSFVGMPAPPMQITLDLLPFMEEELIIMMDKISTANSPISDLVSIMDVH